MCRNCTRHAAQQGPKRSDLVQLRKEVRHIKEKLDSMIDETVYLNVQLRTIQKACPHKGEQKTYFGYDDSTIECQDCWLRY